MSKNQKAPRENNINNEEYKRCRDFLPIVGRFPFPRMRLASRTQHEGPSNRGGNVVHGRECQQAMSYLVLTRWPPGAKRVRSDFAARLRPPRLRRRARLAGRTPGG